MFFWKGCTAIAVLLTGIATFSGSNAPRVQASSPPQNEDVDGLPTVDPDAWLANSQPPPDKLRAYMAAAEPINRKLALAQQVFSCGLKPAEWINGVNLELERYRAGPYVGRLFGALSADDRRRAMEFDRRIFNEAMSIETPCSMIASAPFIYNPAAFSP